MEKIIISIIIPVYNGEKFIAHCLDSVIGQTYPHLEIIIVEDGSTDRTYEICSDYAQKDNRIRLLKNTRRGVSEARNTGLSLASGHYIQFVDADDTVSPDISERLLSAIQKTNADVALCNYSITYYRKGKLFKTIDISYPYTENKIINNCLESFTDLREKGLMNVCWNKLYRNDIIKKHSIVFPKDYPIGEDQFFALDYWNTISSYVVIPDKLYNYRIINKFSITSKFHPDFHNYSLAFIHHAGHVCSMMPTEKNKQALSRIILCNASVALTYIVTKSKHTSFAIMIQAIRKVMNDPLIKEMLKTKPVMHWHYTIIRFFIYYNMIFSCIVFIKTRFVTKLLLTRLSI